MADLSDEIRAIACEAGALVLAARGGDLGIEMKPGEEPVTIADRRASELIVARLAERFPADPVISEELAVAPGALHAPRVWLVDPIDGTKDFIRGSDGFAVMIGLLVNGRPSLGVVHQPAIDRTFFTTEGGARVAVGAQTTRLQVSDVAKAAEARLVASASSRTSVTDRIKEMLNISDEQNIGSLGVKLCLIAMGVRDLYVNPTNKSKAWDTCAPEAVLAMAGGELTDLTGAPIDYRQLAQPRGLVASNGRIHAEVIAKLAPLFGR
jgi:3'(2'), 5'-bisphosphate nucleotidase